MDNELKHHGILGMKWGVHRSPEQLSRDRGVIDAASQITKEARNINNSIASAKSISRNKNIENMTDEELRKRVNRLSMEQSYSQLSASQKVKGQQYVENVLSVAGSVLAITSSALGIALAIKKLKK